MTGAAEPEEGDRAVRDSGRIGRRIAPEQASRAPRVLVQNRRGLRHRARDLETQHSDFSKPWKNVAFGIQALE